MIDSLDPLSKSQLFTLRGQAIADTLDTGGTANSNVPHSRLSNNVIIDQKYKIICLLGKGGMGAVYKAHHLLLDKDVALKTFRSPYLTDDSWKRFHREAQAIARLSHKNIVHVFDFGVGEDNVPYYTMECLSGESLADRLAVRGALPLDQTIEIFLQVCQGLSMAHSKGIIHRDLKPDNIFLANDASLAGSVDLVKIVDFGIAGLATRSLDGQKLTSAGTIFGSPLYMSPEQSLGSEVTERSDIYSCGCALFETLTGSPPFRGEHPFETMLMHQNSPVPRLDDRDKGRPFSQRLIALVAKMLAKNEEERFQSFTEVSDELNEVLKRHKLGPSAERQYSSSTPALVQSLNRQGQDDKKHRLLFRRAKELVFSSIICLTLIGVAVISYRQFKPTIKVASPPIGTEKLQHSVKPPAEDNVTSAVINPYLQNPKATASEWRRFVFPKNKSLGLLHWRLENDSNQNQLSTDSSDIEAKGLVLVPPRSMLELDAMDALADRPDLFNGFGVNDLARLKLSTDISNSWKDNHIAYIARLTGLISLIANYPDVSDICINDLNKLTKLRSLSIVKAPISGTALAKLRRLPKLECLIASGIGTMSMAVKKMINCQSIKKLTLEQCNLTNGDMEVIGTMSNLELLNISSNIKITDLGLQSIGKLQKLNYLLIRDTSVSPACIETIKKMPSLRRLSIDFERWSPADKEHLERILAYRCQLVVKDFRADDVADVLLEPKP